MQRYALWMRFLCFSRKRQGGFPFRLPAKEPRGEGKRWENFIEKNSRQLRMKAKLDDSPHIPRVHLFTVWFINCLWKPRQTFHRRLAGLERQRRELTKPSWRFPPPLRRHCPTRSHRLFNHQRQYLGAMISTEIHYQNFLSPLSGSLCALYDKLCFVAGGRAGF